MTQTTVPWQSLAEQTLKAVIEDFVTREGTEYGSEEVNLPKKVAQVLKQLQKGEAVIVFDTDSDSCSIQPIRDLEP